MPIYLCPSTGGRTGNQDAEGYGYTDYSAPVTVRPGLSGNPNQPRFKCALNGDSKRRIRSITDGTSHTVAVAEELTSWLVDTTKRRKKCAGLWRSKTWRLT